MDHKKSQYFSELLLKFRDNSMNDEELRQFEAELRVNSEARKYYVESAIIHSLFQGRKSMHFDEPYAQAKTEWDHKVWEDFAAYEKTAPKIEFSEEEPQHELIQKVIYPPREKRKISKFAVFTFINAAAVILIFLFLKFIPPNTGIEVATLTDSINAKWADIAGPLEKGTRITTGSERLLLRQGYAELLFDTNARIVVEAPAELQILAEDRIGLKYGKVYAWVPKEALGFSVYTQNAKIIDMGTEFGVDTDSRGDTRLHVLKGKTMLIAGQQSSKKNIEVSKGQAKRISVTSSEVSDISCDSGLFVRNIDSDVGVLWKGQNKISLADIVGGGNGFGTGKVETGIDPVSGSMTSERPGTQASANDYRRVTSMLYVDGVFVPNGQTQQIVSSEGHLFAECPVTNGLCCESLFHVERSLDDLAIQNKTQSKASAQCILLHANMGITFDLKAIRTLLPGAKITRFQSQLGMRKWAARPSASNADFWILIDGKVRYEKKQVRIDELSLVDIELSETDRFLTLVLTDGGDPEGRIFDNLILQPHDSDWGIFADPILLLE